MDKLQDLALDILVDHSVPIRIYDLMQLNCTEWNDFPEELQSKLASISAFFLGSPSELPFQKFSDKYIDIRSRFIHEAMREPFADAAAAPISSSKTAYQKASHPIIQVARAFAHLMQEEKDLIGKMFAHETQHAVFMNVIGETQAECLLAFQEIADK